MKRVLNGTGLAALVLLTVLGAGCARREVTRIDPNTTTDLSGRWNDTDSRLVAEEMISDLLSKPWLENWTGGHGGKAPVFITGSIRNKSMEHIATGTFLRDMERELVNAGKVQVVASAEEREEVRDEKLDQRLNATPETLKKMGQELGADYMLLGEINQINDSEGKTEVRYYQVDLTLVNIQTNVKEWLGQKKIKKAISNGSYSP